jgi:hypothetical protein
MTARLRSVALASSLALSAFVAAPSSFAQAPAAPPAQDGNAAVKLAKEGRVAYDAGRWDEAYDLFAKAQAAASSPMFELYMARSRRNAKKLLEARTVYLSITRRELPEGAPAAWQQALGDARSELAVLIGQIPSIVVDVTGAAPGTTVRVDASPVRPGETVDVDPGEHVVVATSDGQSLEKRVTVAMGQRGIRVALGDAGAASPPEPGPPAPSEADAGGQGSIVPGVIALAVGGAALGAGAVFGALALGADSDVTARCPDDRCGSDDDLTVARDDQSSSQGLADVSTVMFIVGGVAAATGVVLLVVRPGSGSDTRETASLAIRPGGVSISGGF